LAERRAQVAARPDSAVSEHNLAALLGNMGRAVEAEAAVRRALAKGGDAPETWLVLARALLAQARYDDAETAFVQVLARRPLYLDAIRELSQLVWMRTADLQAALAPIDAAIALSPGLGGLHVLRALMREYANDPAEAILRDLQGPGVLRDTAVELASAQAAMGVDREAALTHALAAMALAPHDNRVALKLAEVHLSRGEPAQALELLDAVLERLPTDQNALSLQATAWRLTGDARALSPSRYSSVVGGYTIDTPDGWPSLNAWLADLAAALRSLHGLTTHPVGQSLRHGTQTTVNLLTSDDPAIRAFFTAIDRPIREHLRKLGRGSDPLRRRNTGDYRLSGCWSVELRPGGFHASHVHPEGWLSSACYIDLPPAIEAGGRQGWIGFGSPPFDCGRSLAPEHYEKPAPGRLVLFPSYMWHGTVPFEGPETRLTIAFDVVPA